MLYPTDEEAGYSEPPVCPLCHQRCDTIYRTDDGTIVGCDRCLEAAQGWDFRLYLCVRDGPDFMKLVNRTTGKYIMFKK